jgi:hypothetical protein
MAMKGQFMIDKILVIGAILLFSARANAFELKEDSPEERCGGTPKIHECVKQCKQIGMYSGGNESDLSPLYVKYCNSVCDDYMDYCLSHDGAAMVFPDYAPSSIGKILTLWCLKEPAKVRKYRAIADCRE